MMASTIIFYEYSRSVCGGGGVSPLTSRGGTCTDYGWECHTKALPVSILLGVIASSDLLLWRILWVEISLNHALSLHSTIVGNGVGEFLL